MAVTAVSPQDDGTRPPSALQPTTMTLATLHANYLRALGAPLPTSVIETWSVTRDGLTGTLVVTVRGDDKREDEQLGAELHTADGVVGGRSWQQNENGEITYPTGVHRRAEIDAAALRSGAPGVALLGMLAEEPARYVVRVDPPGGRLEYVYFDSSTFLIDQIDEALEGTRVIFTFDGYRNVGGRMVAGHVHTIVARTGIEGDRVLRSSEVDSPPHDDALAMPTPASPLSAAHFPVELPARILSDRIILKTRIKNRPVNLQLDSGASAIAIDTGVIDALGIPKIGASKGTMAGTYSVSQAIVPELQIGDVSLHNVAVYAIPFVELADEHTPVAGLIGFDFLNTAVFKIDYVKGTVTALDPATFTPPSGAFEQDIALDDNVPMLSATIGNATGKTFVLDTGADRSAIYSPFRLAHPDAVADQGLGTRLRDAFPFETQFTGVGGQVTYHPVQVRPFTFGGVTFSSWLFDATYNAASFEGEDNDGLIGQDVLRYFDLYLDYPHSRIYFVPNSRYVDRFG
ncbi:MAG: aspartyl protease family protein [Candidatus Aquilonibacter sp.]